MAFSSKILVSVLVLFSAEIQICTNLCSFSIENGLTSKTSKEIQCFFVRFHRFGLRNGIFSKIFIRCLFYFAPKFIFAQICVAFLLEMSQRARLCRMFIVFQQILSFRPPKLYFLKNFRFGSGFFFFYTRIQFQAN